MKPQRQRLRGETLSFRLDVGNGNHEIRVMIGYDENYQLHEISFISSGKIGQGLDLLFKDLGVKLSRAIQGRNPDTGEDDVSMTS